MLDQSLKFVKAGSLVLAAALVLAGCTATTVKHQPKAKYTEFSDSTWRPETAVRPPFKSNEIAVDAVAALTEGMHAYYDTHRSTFALQDAGNGKWNVTETTQEPGERLFTWGKGAVQIIRNGRVMANEGPMVASLLPDGRILLQNSGKAVFNLALVLRAFDISGKPVRQLLRNGNNQPDTLAWFIPGEARFPKGSVAYLATYWLGDDELVMPSSSAFTGANRLENLVTRYAVRKAPYCISYLSHLDSTPYGLTFKPAESTKRVKSARSAAPQQGRFELTPVQRSNMFCEKLPEAAPKGGSWKIGRIQSTRVMELTEDANVESADMGIQPINSAAVDIGFAEVMRANGGRSRLQVVPVRIIRNNEPVTDFRLQFNPTAAQAIDAVLGQAEAARLAHEAQKAQPAAAR